MYTITLLPEEVAKLKEVLDEEIYYWKLKDILEDSKENRDNIRIFQGIDSKIWREEVKEDKGDGNEVSKDIRRLHPTT